jgi:hypothetical protein
MARPPSFAALAASLLRAGCATLAAPPAAERGIVVIGTGRVAARPDTAVVSLGAEARAPRLADATAEVDRAMRAVLARVREAGVADADIRTLVYAIEPIAEPRPPGEPSVRVAGYRVSNVVQVRIRDARAVARLVDAAVAAGANVVRDVHFTLDDPSRPEAEARALAMRDAAARARQLAAAAGVSLGRLLSVTESSPVRPLARMSLASAPGPVEPGQLEVTVSVEARYAIAGGPLSRADFERCNQQAWMNLLVVLRTGPGLFKRAATESRHGPAEAAFANAGALRS